MSDEEGDFEPTAPDHIMGSSHAGRTSPEPILGLDASIMEIQELNSRERVAGRSANMATVRQNRRTQLAEKLRDVFELDNINEVVAGQCLWRRYMCSTTRAHPLRRDAMLASALGP